MFLSQWSECLQQYEYETYSREIWNRSCRHIWNVRSTNPIIDQKSCFNFFSLLLQTSFELCGQIFCRRTSMQNASSKLRKKDSSRTLNKWNVPQHHMILATKNAFWNINKSHAYVLHMWPNGRFETDSIPYTTPQYCWIEIVTVIMA